MEDWDKENAKSYFVDNNNGKNLRISKVRTGCLISFPDSDSFYFLGKMDSHNFRTTHLIFA
jgi:hypothetical protein